MRLTTLLLSLWIVALPVIVSARVACPPGFGNSCTCWREGNEICGICMELRCETWKVDSNCCHWLCIIPCAAVCATPGRFFAGFACSIGCGTITMYAPHCVDIAQNGEQYPMNFASPLGVLCQ